MGLRQAELAERANVSTVTLSHLESGKGANLTSLVKVLRALEADDWIDLLAPAPEFSPLAVLEQTTGGSGQARRERQRVRAPRGDDR